MRKCFLSLSLFTFTMLTYGQTLFTYGKYKVDAKEFVRAYNKNNTQPVMDKAKAMRTYLDLYINSRLKIRDAYDRKFDTLTQVVFEAENLRSQIAENFMQDPELTPKLQKEAFERSQRDIKVAHIFIPFKKNDEADTSSARIKLQQLTDRLKKGEDFAKLASEFSSDTSTSFNGGEIGYITVFTLPYEIENAIFTTSVGKYSTVITSKSGYHIFKNLGERKAVGKMKAKQILLAIPPDSDEASKKRIAALADSLYQAIRKGSDIGMLSVKFSDDYISAANNGGMRDITVGSFDPKFEALIWSLGKDGDLSKPILTSHGWHIVQRESVIPVTTDSSNSANKQELLNKIKADNRWKSSRGFIYKKVLASPGVKKSKYTDEALWGMSDSLIARKPMTEAGKTLTPNSTLFKIGDSAFTVSQWIIYAGSNHFQPDGTVREYPQLREEFIQLSMYNFYRDKLEDYNEEFRNQMAEFKDGNIFFEIMQQEIWNKAQNDSAALKTLYGKNKAKYTWKNSADAVVFYTSDQATAKFIYDEIKKDPRSWRKISEQYAEKVVADSSRFELEQIPVAAGITPKIGMLTMPVVNANDNSASFAYVISVSNEPLQRSYAEARGLVINDYQLQLEKDWVEKLRKKYPVVINQKTFDQLAK